MGFLGLEDANSERDLGGAILRCWRGSCWIWGRDFSFIARQKRMTTRERDFYPDLGGIFVDFTISEPAISPSISDTMVASLLGMQLSSW